MSDIGRCRRCPAPMRWVVMAGSGRKNPLDVEPDLDRGNVLVDPLGQGHAFRDGPAARAALAEQKGWAGPYLSHFVTCPRRREFGRR